MSDHAKVPVANRNRRVLLGASAAAALTLWMRGSGWSAIPKGSPEDAGKILQTPWLDLYAFPSATPNKTTLAMTWGAASANAGSIPKFTMARFHADGSSLTVPLTAIGADQTMSTFVMLRSFIGRVAGQGPGQGHAHAAVIEVENGGPLAPGGRVAVWGELLAADGRRLRAGSPLLQPLLDGDAALTAQYHSLDPRQDMEHLARLVMRAREAVSQGGSVPGHLLSGGSEADLLPDVLYYDPRLPCGFTFAALNGRRPADRAETVAAAIVGVAAPRRKLRMSLRTQERFPYFYPVHVA